MAKNNINKYYNKLPKKIKNNMIAKIIMVVIALIYVADYYNLTPLAVGELTDYNNTITTINVGQGESTLIESEGEFLLIDAGGDKDENVVSHLSARKISEIEVLLITHFHQDHISAVEDVLENFTVKNIIIPNLSEDNMPTTDTFNTIISEIEMQKIPVFTAQKGDTYSIGEGELLILLDTPQNVSDVNDTSIISLFSQGDFTYLSTGDANSSVEDLLIGSVAKDITMLNIGHHGSSGSTSGEFLNYVSPEFAVISAGEDNSYNHPHSETVQKLEDRNIPYKVSFNEGDIVYSITQKSLLEK